MFSNVNKAALIIALVVLLPSPAAAQSSETPTFGYTPPSFTFGGSADQVAYGCGTSLCGKSTFTFTPGTDTLGVTRLVAPSIYGSLIANGDIIIEGTAHATVTSATVSISPSGGPTTIGGTLAALATTLSDKLTINKNSDQIDLRYTNGTSNYGQIAFYEGGAYTAAIIATPASFTTPNRRSLMEFYAGANGLAEYAGSAFYERRRVVGVAKALTEGVATSVVQVAVASTTMTGFTVDWTVEATDDTDYQARRGSTYVAVVNKAGTETCTAGDIGTPVVAVSAGTLTVTTACSTSPTNAVDFTIDATSSLTQTALRVSYTVRKDAGTGVISPQ
jgi:hypothetical protein